MEPPRFSLEILRLRHAGWSCKWDDTRHDLPDAIYDRYPWIPEDYLDFITGLDRCASPDGTRWCMAPADFDETGRQEPRHDTWERAAITAADGDETLSKEARRFWDGHLPVFADVSGGHTFHAIRVFDRSGKVVRGNASGFTETVVVADGFTGFLASLA